MFPAWRLKLREAKLAVADGQWDAAAELLASQDLKEFRPAKKLSRDLATRLVARADARLAGGQSLAGWHDLEQAAKLGADEADLDAFCRRHAEARMRDVATLLARGDVAAARTALAKMDDHRLGGQERRNWHAVAQSLDHAASRAAHGDFAAAILAYEEAQRQIPPGAPAALGEHVKRQLAECRKRLAPQGDLEKQLHAAVAAGEWSTALSAADALLELAPHHAAARQARRKAWNAVGMQATQAFRPGDDRPRAAAWQRNYPSRGPAGGPAGIARLTVSRGEGDTVNSDHPSAKRLVAWIDAVGGFLICTGDEIVLGQPSAQGGVDVPILADLSRRHAIIRREGESYVLTPLHATAVDGRPLRESIILRDKMTIRLGDAAELRFRKPHALSATAVLEITSHHKTEPAVDAVVLMSESCILGPQAHSHIQCKHWTGDLVLFRRGEDLMLRSTLPAAVDGEPGVTQALVRAGSHVENEEISLSFEGLS